MYEKIKALADEAIALQNKLRMEAVLREISGICATAGAMDAEQFEAAELAQHQAARGKAAVLADMKAKNAAGIPVVPLKAKKGGKQ